MRERKPSRVGAIVVGGDYQGLAIVRSLGRRGIPTCVIDDERSIARFSRYAWRALAADCLRDEARTVEVLLDAGHRLGLDGWVLFPTRDETVAAISRNRARLAEVFRVPTQAWEVVRVACDKRETYAVASQLGIPVPATWRIRDETELDAIAAPFPFAVKPAVKERFIYATGKKAWRAGTRPELRSRFNAAAAIVGPAEVLIQELIPGDGRQQFAYCALFRDGEAVAKMVVQRRRQHPPEFGRASTYVQTVRLPVLEEMSERFLREIGYHGLAEMEYKLDPRDGHYKLLDFNARTWGYHSLGERAGVDFPYLAYADQLGEPVSACEATPGLSWIRLATDLPTAALELARGRLDLRTYARSLRGLDTEAVLSRRDPLPGLVELLLLPYLAVKRGL